jgi:hypothetical protein
LVLDHGDQAGGGAVFQVGQEMHFPAHFFHQGRLRQPVPLEDQGAVPVKGDHHGRGPGSLQKAVGVGHQGTGAVWPFGESPGAKELPNLGVFRLYATDPDIAEGRQPARVRDFGVTPWQRARFSAIYCALGARCQPGNGIERQLVETS